MTENNKTSFLKVYFLSILAIVLWSMSYLWSDRLILLGIPVEYFVFMRVVIAGLLLLAYNVIVGNSIKIHKKDMWRFVAMSFFEPFIYFVCETHAIRLTESPTYSALIVSTAPIFSVVAGVMIFKEKVTLLNIIGILVCLAGIFMVTFSQESVGEKFIWGVILIIIALFAEVGHASCTKLLSGDYSPQVIVMYQFLMGGLMLFPLFLIQGCRNFDAKLYFSWEVVSQILYLAVFCSGIAFSLWVYTIKSLGVAKSSIFLAIIPVFTAIDAWLLGHEVFSPMQWCGILVASVGVILSQFVVKK